LGPGVIKWPLKATWYGDCIHIVSSDIILVQGPPPLAIAISSDGAIGCKE
jgi:hypothetical protein